MYAVAERFCYRGPGEFCSCSRSVLGPVRTGEVNSWRQTIMSISRRDVLKSLAMSAAATSVLRTIPAQAAEYAHHMVAAEKAATKVYAPKFFAAHEYKTLQILCQTIVPADADSGGVI